MRLKEFEKKLPFDVIDDVAIYMRNDPMIYRKQLFPAIMRMKDSYMQGSAPDANECLGEACGNAMESYCSKFKLGSPENVFKQDDKDALIQKLFSEEMKMIKNGAYWCY